MFNIYQIFVWIILLLFITSQISQKHWKIIFSNVSALLITLEILSIYLTGRLIDYRFYNHININAIEGHAFQFSNSFPLLLTIFISTYFFIYFVSIKINKLYIIKFKITTSIIFISLILLILPNGIIHEIYTIHEILTADEKNFNDALHDVGISPEKYIKPNQIMAKKGKNIIVISIESLEKGFIGDRFDNITPNLKALSKEWNYYNMPPSPGGGWTAGSLFCHQVGMPAFFKGQGNDFFQGTTDVKLTGLGNILTKAGYESKYVLSNGGFAGMSDLLAAYGIKTISGRNFYDLDIFNQAKLQIQNIKRRTNKPFALFLSTINTHFPHGIYDKRMERIIGKRENNLEFSISAVDYLINDFISYLKKENLYTDTAIFIFPDHLMMGIGGEVIDKLSKDKRQLYLITNASEQDLSKNTSDNLHQIELPRMIINGSKINTNAKFLSDFINDKNIDTFLSENIVKLTTLNSASVSRKNYINGINISIVDSELTISSDFDKVSFSLSKKEKDETFDLTFNSKMVLIDSAKIENIIITKYDTEYHRLHLLINTKDGLIHDTYLGDKLKNHLEKTGPQVTYTMEDILLIRESNNDKIQHVNKLKNLIKKNPDQPNLYTQLATVYTKQRDFNNAIKIYEELLSIKPDDSSIYYKIARFHAKQNKKDSSALWLKKAMEKGFSDWELLKNDEDLKILKTTNLYNSALEAYDKKTISETNRIANIYRKGKNRFIAHAGGTIDGHTYTNSLEALNLNYKKGFRLFELDIVKTSDNIYAATHDWELWAKQTDYADKVPPDRKTFLERKILKNYTPMDIKAINTWFSNHPDATLVTDKVNDPIDFSNKFIDKNRLIMELFSLKTVKEGIYSKIKSPMPSFSVLNEINGDKIKFLEDLGITDISMSRRVINTKKEFIKKITDSGINIYAFHINFDKGIDEIYVVCNENKYFYGIYADKWNFNAELDCSSQTQLNKKKNNIN